MLTSATFTHSSGGHLYVKQSFDPLRTDHGGPVAIADRQGVLCFQWLPIPSHQEPRMAPDVPYQTGLGKTLRIMSILTRPHTEVGWFILKMCSDHDDCRAIKCNCCTLLSLCSFYCWLTFFKPTWQWMKTSCFCVFFLMVSLKGHHRDIHLHFCLDE